MDKNTTKTLLVVGGSILVLGAVVFAVKRVSDKVGLGISGKQDKGKGKIVGKQLKLTGAYANVRKDPSVPPNVVGSIASTASWALGLGGLYGNSTEGGTDNLIGKATYSPVGTIKDRIVGDDGYTWYEVSLSKKLNGESTGYIREDVVEIIF